MNNPKPQFMWRALASVLVAVSFFMLLLSGAMLFVAPPGRVANWSNWRLLGLTKHDWGGLHVWFAVLFVLAAAFHILFNWRPLLNYFKDRLSRRLALRREWIVGLALGVAVFAGTQAAIPPFSTLLAFNERIKQGWENERAAAPIPHAELLTLRALAEKAGLPYETAVERLEARGLNALGPDIIVAALAQSNLVSPQRIFEIIQGARGRGRGPAHGEKQAGEKSPSYSETAGRGGPGGGGGGAGAGRRTLAEYCAARGLDLQTVSARLQAQGIKFTPDRSLRDIALDNGFDRPYGIIDIIEGKD
ncbi:MAG TPA: DUF4405 domain-containing protein [Candidatus Paceibacterota bacterium]|nr:DUF4405 domain-containing protein [Candidatus Paceibacterota bacterium]